MADSVYSQYDDVPPLEDMSSLLNEVHKISPLTSISSYSQPKANQPAVSSTSLTEKCVEVSEQKSNNTPSNSKVQNDKKSNSFGGMKKGFLFSSPQGKKTKPVPEESKTDSTSMPYIKKAETEDRLKIDEVQNAMKLNENLLQNKDWVNDDLLKQIEENDILYSKLSNPQFAAAIAEFQSNPQAAMMKYADNAEMQKFLKEFCGVMGNHFSALGEKTASQGTSDIRTKPMIEEGAIKSEDEQKLEEILSSDKVRNILTDEKVQNLFHILRKNPEAGQRILNEADSDLKMKIKVLIDAGLLQVEQR